MCVHVAYSYYLFLLTFPICIFPSSFFMRLTFSSILLLSLTFQNQTLYYVWLSPGLLHYINTFGGSCLLTEFCLVQNSLYVLQVLRSPILAALLHGTPAAGVSEIAVWYKEWNYGTFAEGATFFQLGGHHVGHRPTF